VKRKFAAYTLAVILAFISIGQCQLAIGSGGQRISAVPVDYFQSVGGTFGKEWIDNFLARSDPPVQTSNNTSLWTWGDTPIGKTQVNGRLVPTDGNGTVTIRARDWLGETPLGAPAYLNSSYNTGFQSPFSDMYLSDDPWIRAQQLETVVRTPTNYQPAS
jgi:hypothetical protein